MFRLYLFLRTSSAASLFLAAIISHSASADEPAARGQALLIGCTKYDNLDASLHLEGPANDVELMNELLCQRFGFSGERVVSLSESSGRPERRPTRANIEREFVRLGREAIAGEQVVVFLAGHGSQQPNLNPTEDDPEPDGLDELFLPADVQAWNGGIGRVPNAIVDDELHGWLKAIEQRRAAVTVIVDSCHSGTMTRGVGERVRQIPPGILVPEEEISKARKRISHSSVTSDVEQTRGARPPETEMNRLPLVAIYASQSSEVTIEKRLPAEGQDRKPHGLLTYTLCQILSRQDNSMTCRELVRQIQTHYAGAGRSTPTPMIEGRERDREVFGLTVWPEQSRIQLTKTSRGSSINAGHLKGITQNSILAVYTPGSGRSDQIVGYVRVQIARTLDADVVPCQEDGQAATTPLPASGRCELVFADAGDLRLRVALSIDAQADPDWVQRFRQRLQPESLKSQQVHLVQLVESELDAEWLLRIGSAEVSLIPAESAAVGDGIAVQKTIPGFASKPLNASTEEWLAPALDRIARAANLKSIAANDNTSALTTHPARVDVQLERNSAPQSTDVLQRTILGNGDKITFRVKNSGSFPVDVTLLCIDSEYGITALYPQEGEINRLEPENTFSVSTRVVAESPGIEHLVAIAVKANREVIDFTCLAQPSLDSLKTRGGTGPASLASPLGQLLKHAMFAEGQTRGIKRATVNAHSLQLLTWEIRP